MIIATKPASMRLVDVYNELAESSSSLTDSSGTIYLLDEDCDSCGFLEKKLQAILHAIEAAIETIEKGEQS